MYLCYEKHNKLLDISNEFNAKERAKVSELKSFIEQLASIEIGSNKKCYC